MLDASKVSFIDHHSLMVLDDYAHEHEVTVVLRTPARVIEALNLAGVRVESAA